MRYLCCASFKLLRKNDNNRDKEDKDRKDERKECPTLRGKN